MLTKKQLLRRIRSLEEMLNVVYSSDACDDEGCHVADEYGRIKNYDALVKKDLEEKLKDK